MPRVRFLTVSHVTRLHARQIDRFGGSHGVRDIGLLASAVAQPYAAFGGEFLHKDVFEMASAYLFHIASNHPFIDGNKRAAASATLVFLKVNGFKLIASDEEYSELVLSVASGTAAKSEVTEFIRKYSVPLS